MGTLKEYLLIYRRVTSGILRWAMDFDEAELLMRITSQCNGDHLEIGTLWGGSAIGVALAKSKGEIYCIDPFNKRDSVMGKEVKVGIVEANIKKFGITNIHLYKQKHPPMPPKLEKHKFDTALIDGKHTTTACLANWLDVKDRVKQYVIFHDIDFQKRVKPVWNMALHDPQWAYIEVAGDLGVIKRVK